MNAYMKNYTHSNYTSEVILNHSYGIEFETHDGFIPEYQIYDSGLIPLRDGSLRHDSIQPYEYATIPMDGKDTLSMVEKQSKVLAEHCKIDPTRSSLHVHQGQHELTPEYVIAYYKLATLLQEELYSMFPSYVKNSASVKGKDYCSPIPTLLELRKHYEKNTSSINESTK